MKIIQVNKTYQVTLPTGKLYILSRKALIWNLKNVFGIKGENGKRIMAQLDMHGHAELKEVA